MTQFPKTLLTDVERAAVRGWPAFEQIEVMGWLYRRSAGGSIRANTVAALAFSGPSVEAGIDEIERLARTRELPASFTVSDVSVPGDLDVVLEARGYHRGARHVTMAKAAAGLPQPPVGLEIGDKPSPSWMAVYLSGLAVDRRAAAAQLISGLPKSARYFSVHQDDRVISCGASIVDGSVASVQCMATLPDALRLGGARRVLGAIETVATVSGAQFLYLQTGAENRPARGLYQATGFSVLGHYHTRTREFK